MLENFAFEFDALLPDVVPPAQYWREGDRSGSLGGPVPGLGIGSEGIGGRVPPCSVAVFGFQGVSAVSFRAQQVFLLGNRDVIVQVPVPRGFKGHQKMQKSRTKVPQWCQGRMVKRN